MSGGPFIPVGVLGGTFDPIHYGHLRSALELCECLSLHELRLMPCATPPHRALPGTLARQRVEMVDLAVQGESRLVCDDRELRRTGLSYTIDSLIELRGELGSDKSLSLIIGFDALLGIADWHRWNELLDWAHVVAIARPGWHLPESGVVAQWMQENAMGGVEEITERAAGGVLVQELRPLAISSTEIRTLLNTGQSARYLTPESVLDYIYINNLYNSDNRPDCG